MTKRQYCARWTPEYREKVGLLAKALGANGCTWALEFYHDGCLEHDITYRSGLDPLAEPITRKEADRRLRWYIQCHSPFGILNPMSWWRWVAVRLLARGAWKRDLLS